MTRPLKHQQLTLTQLNSPTDNDFAACPAPAPGSATAAEGSVKMEVSHDFDDLDQVCPPTLNFFHVYSLRKIIDLPGGQINDPQMVNTLLPSSQQLPLLCLGPLKGFFELTLHPSTRPQLALCVASGTTKIQGQCQFCSSKRGPTSLSTTFDTNLDCAFV